MKLRFTKMQGAGNDFVVFDAVHSPIEMTPAQYRKLGDRHFGVGADQILRVERSRVSGVDFAYRIFNAESGEDVEQCGNGARCFMRYVHDKGLSDKPTLRVETVSTLLELSLQDDGRVAVDMGRPVFDLAQVPFRAAHLVPRAVNGFQLWPLELAEGPVEVAVLSMGNPHAVQLVADVGTALVSTVGAEIERHARFPRQVNAGFMQILSRGEVRLRVFERGAGETLACGTGACAAVVAGIRLGLLDRQVDVQTRGGPLRVGWARGELGVLMTGPAETVFEGEINL
ncbi:MAG: diaminopimelate epimerase [Burkholderiaceae bacterium]|nr:diaminopimelate epimerase [Burkholderiaceae bacterium]